MSSELTNLLPQERQGRIVREYCLHFGVVATLVLSLLVCVAGVLLFPTYVLLSANETAKEMRLANITSKLSSADEVTLSSRLAILSSNANALVSLSDRPSASLLVHTVLAVPRPGILLTGLSHTVATAKTPGTLTLSGTAATRDALRSYQLALQKAPFARSAELPVSVYAKDANIPFTVTLSLRP